MHQATCFTKNRFHTSFKTIAHRPIINLYYLLFDKRCTLLWFTLCCCWSTVWASNVAQQAGVLQPSLFSLKDSYNTLSDNTTMRNPHNNHWTQIITILPSALLQLLCPIIYLFSVFICYRTASKMSLLPSARMFSIWGIEDRAASCKEGTSRLLDVFFNPLSAR